MNLKLRCCFILIFIFLYINIYAQKGTPSDRPVSISTNTAYPQVEEFTESMVGKLTVPSGFKVEIAASGLGKPRMMAALDNNSVYVTRRDQGDVILLKDKDGDGKFDEMTTVYSMFKGVHGITIHDGYIYLCANSELRRAKIKPDGSFEKDTTLVTNLPGGGQHGNRTIAFGPDNMMYITVGSDCNDCFEPDPEHATILQASADASSRKVYARGLRNTIGFGWNPVTKEMWGADNGADYKGEDWPPDELNKIVEDGHYGWPVAYANREVDYTREDPPGITKDNFAQKTEASVLNFPAHSAPIAMTFLDNSKSFPSDYSDDALLCLHGSWNKKNPDGYKVVRIKFENGKATGYEDFLSGFLEKDGKSRFGRPAGIISSKNGSVYVSDDENGIIYKVSYNNQTK